MENLSITDKSLQSVGKRLNSVIYDKVNYNALNLTSYYKNQHPPTDGSHFTDNLFPANDNSIFGRDANGNYLDPHTSRTDGYTGKDFKIKEGEIEWFRAKEIFPGGKYSIFCDNIDPSDIKQGSVGDCYFMSAIGALSEFPQLVAQVFRTLEVPDNGCYEIAMRINAEWKIVLVDDYFACKKGTKEPIFCKPHDAELWVMLLEKAWAKVNGGYINIVGGWPTEVLSVLTSFPIENYRHKDYTDPAKKKEFWDKIKLGDLNNYVMATSTINENSIEEEFGLVACHAYSLLSAVEGIVNGESIQLVKLRNPWSRGEWTGDWSDMSSKWTEEARKVFGLEKQVKDDGVFWMSYDDFFKYYNISEVCKVSSPDGSVSVKIPENRVEGFNVYELVLEHKTDIDVSIIKKHYRFNRKIGPDDSQVTNLIIVKKEGDKLIYKDSASTGPTNPHISLQLDAGHYLIYFNVNYQTGKFDKKRKYVLYVSCDHYFELYDKGEDTSLTLLKEIIITQIKSSDKFADQISKDYVQIRCNAFEKTTFGFMYIWNKLQSNYLIKTVTGAINGMTLISDYSGEANVPKGSDWICIANRNSYYITYCFDLDYSNDHSTSNDDSACIRSQECLNNFFVSSNTSPITCDYIYNKIKFDLSSVIKQIDPIETSKESLLEKYPKEMKELVNLPAVTDGVKTIFNDIYKWESGNNYLGEWMFEKASVRHGRGKMTWSDGTVLVGYWDKDVTHGPSKEYYPQSGAILEIHYLNGQQHGEGKRIAADGTVSWLKYDQGTFVAWITKEDEVKEIKNILLDKFPKEMKELLDLEPLTDGIETIFKDLYTWDSGSSYLGEWKVNGGAMHGRGRTNWPGGSSLVGQQIDNSYFGLCKQYYADGDVLEINFTEGKMHGEGIMIYHTGKQSRIKYDNGAFVAWL